MHDPDTDPKLQVSDTFTDALGRRWRLRITLGDLERSRKEAGVPLAEVMRSDRGLADLVFGPPEQLGRLLWTLCAAQAEEQGVTPEQFADGFDGSTLESAVEALLVAIADFSPRSVVGRQARESLPALLADLDRRAAESIRQAASRATSRN